MKELIHIANPTHGTARTNHTTLPFSMTYVRSDAKHITFLPIYPGGAEHISMPEGDTPLHQHSYFELFYLLDGEAYQTIESGTFRYRRGEACLMNRNIRHCERSSTIFSGVFLNLMPGFLTDLLEHDLVSTDGQPPHPADGPIRHFLFSNLRGEEQYRRSYLHFSHALSLDSSPEPQCPAEFLLDQIAEEMLAQKSGASYILPGLLCRFLATLENPQQYRLTHMELDSSNEDFLYARILGYLAERKGQFSRPELSEALHYHAEYLNQIVKKKTGMSLMKLAKTYRIAEARRLLAETNKSVSEIAQELGYVSRSHFYRLFEKETGQLPLDYRRTASRTK